MTPHQREHQWRDDYEHRRRKHQLPGAPSPARDRIADQRRHHHPAERLPAHHDPQRDTAALAEPVGYNQRGGYEGREAESQAERRVRGQHRRERTCAARRDQPHARENRPDCDDGARFDSFQELSRQRRTDSRGQREHREQHRHLSAPPAELLEQWCDEKPRGVVTRTPKQEQREEEASGNQPTLTFAARHATLRTNPGYRTLRRPCSSRPRKIRVAPRRRLARLSPWRPKRYIYMRKSDP